MSERRPCVCGFVSVSPDADSSAVCGGCGRPLGGPLEVPDGSHTLDFAPPLHDATADPPPGPAPVRRGKRAAPPTPPPDVPGFDILGELGRGGMGVVYKAREKALNRVVALKMILAGAHAGDAERARFKREAEAVAALHHAGIVQIFHVGEHAGQPYLVLEYVDGGNLADRIAGGNLLPVREAAAVVQQLAEAMQYAHEQGVIHRDLKPANILLSKADGGGRKGEGGSSSLTPSSGSAVRHPSTLFKISDFGLAKKIDDTIAAGGGTRTGAVMGTPSYISPEQAAGKSHHVTARSDVYSLGAILYEMLTDRPPFKADTPLETVLQVINDDPVPPSKLRPKLPRDLETVCLKCLHKDPARRYATAAELAADLGRFLRGEPIHARPVSAAARGWQWAKRHPALSVFGVTAAAAVAAVVAVLIVSNAELTNANRQKEQEARTAREQKERAEWLAAERQQALVDLDAEGERTRRGLFALQLAQVAGIVARDPATALRLLDDPVKCPVELRDFTWRYLRKLCQRNETIMTAHRRPVRALAVSPDGLLVATADSAGGVYLWHPPTRVVYARLVGHRQAVSGVAFAPDGTTLATTGTDGTVRVWTLDPELLDTVRYSSRLLPDAQAEINRFLPAAVPGLTATLKPAATLPAFGRGGRCVAFSSDGKYLAAGGSDAERIPGQGDGIARVWEVASILPTTDPPRAAVLGAAAATSTPTNTPRPVKEVRHHLQPVTAIAFAPNGQTLATGSEDRGVILSSMAADRREELRLHGGPVFALAFSPDGTTLATADNDENPVIVLWDLTKRRATEKGKLIGHYGPVNGLAFAPDGRSVASAAAAPDPTVRVWDVDTATETSRLRGHLNSVNAVGWMPDRRTLVSASEDGTARLWQTTPRASEAIALFGDEPAKVLAAALTPSGNTLVTADARGDVRLWALDKLFNGRQERAELPVYLSSGKAADAREWQVNALAVADDGLAVAAASPDGVRVWDLTRGRRVFGAAVLTVPAKHLAAGTDVRAVRFTPTGMVVALTATGLRAWDPATGEDRTPNPWRAATTDDLGYALAVSPDGGTVVAAGRERGEPGLLVATAEGVRFVPTPSAVLAIDFSPDGRSLATTCRRGAGRVWRVEPGGLVPECEIAEPLSAVRYCREGKTLMGVRANREVVLLDAACGVERGALAGHADRIVGAGLTPRDHLLITVGRDGVVKRWSGEPTGRVAFRGDWLPGQTVPFPPPLPPR